MRWVCFDCSNYMLFLAVWQPISVQCVMDQRPLQRSTAALEEADMAIPHQIPAMGWCTRQPLQLDRCFDVLDEGSMMRCTR